MIGESSNASAGPVVLRDAVPADAPGIASIYNDAVRHSTAIWNDVEVDAGNRAEWIAARRRDGFPVLVAVDGDGAVLAYGSFGPWRNFDGYRHTVEHSVYVRGDCRGMGLGRRMLAALVDAARVQGRHVMVAAIDASNTPSITLHRQLGFEESGLVREAGFKFGRWLDLLFMRLQLDERGVDERSVQTSVARALH
ncbi:GNAT family N-acetyltransferase [Bordetella sp. J329]|jgi:phosphinothricin acetyltransferase|uniref:GNAT family N-acetyltransferase n=1 Tax=Kerstersia gyiorum TaxID=206506 RepID=UPI000FDC5620|nr:GNAT family N-acetyltransferase [Kerstersia gyiorum]AZV95364.1 GNAT family N-acetyltransferase [Bordetella sp. J329]MCH4272943.1 GNAT family N-acetyltransferase [Kerstersia gyiorum]MCI1227911.1 GNAT family N-acetyltransferase [Kerstersia gyiorum]